MDKKGPNFTSAETHALLQSVRNNYDSIVAMVSSGQQSQSLHGIPNVVLDGESQVVNAPDVTHTIQDEVLLTHVDPEAGPSARPYDTLQEPPRKRKCKSTRQPEQRDEAYETLLSRDTERAEMQILKTPDHSIRRYNMNILQAFRESKDLQWPPTADEMELTPENLLPTDLVR
ncbi:Sarcolemmal membrane-associated protein, partial [Dissostichus eleginoides]